MHSVFQLQFSIKSYIFIITYMKLRASSNHQKQRSFSVKLIKQVQTPSQAKNIFSITQPHLALTINLSNYPQSFMPKQILPPLINENQLQQIFKKHYSKLYIRSLVDYFSSEWDSDMKQLIESKQFLAASSLVLERIQSFKPLLCYLLPQLETYSLRESKILLSVNYKEYFKLMETFQIITRLTSQYVNPSLISQKQDLDYLYITLLRLYNPIGISSQQQLKNKFDSLLGSFNNKKSQLSATLNPTLRTSLDFIIEVQKVIDFYQKQTVRYKSLFQQSQKQKFEAIRLLETKTNFIPVEIDYTKIKQIKDLHKKEIMADLDSNIVKFYKNRMKTYDKQIDDMKHQIQTLTNQNKLKNQEIFKLELQIRKIRDMRPIMKQMGTQLSVMVQGDSTSSHHLKSIGYQNFIENVNSPFKFTSVVTSSFIHQLVLDKILFDYEIIRLKHKLKPLKHFVYQWFIIKTGCKIVAQIFVKNFILSIKSMRKTHKRYELTAKMMGITEVKQRSLMQDLEIIFCQTQLAWYYYVKILLMYRHKFNVNNSGYPILPPVNCEQVMKLPLRKTYELVNQFLQQQNLPKPPDLNTKLDLYCINQISSFKQGTEIFEKQRKQQIHILGQINFDTIAGFIIQYAASIKCTTVDKFLRSLQTKIREKNAQLSYTEFELIYKKIYKQRRSKAQSLYSKFVMTKQEDTMNLQNMDQVVFSLLEDEAPIRSVFDKIGIIKDLVLDERAAMKWQIEKKTTSHANAYQNFRERYYSDFYDFYSSVKLLYHIFKSIRNLIRKFLRDQKRRQNNLTLGDQQESNEEEQHEEYVEKIKGMESNRTPQFEEEEKTRKKSILEAKVEEFKILLTKIPIFPKNIITIDQLVVHSMRRKDSIDITQYSWRVLRQILITITEKNLKN